MNAESNITETQVYIQSVSLNQCRHRDVSNRKFSCEKMHAEVRLVVRKVDFALKVNTISARSAGAWSSSTARCDDIFNEASRATVTPCLKKRRLI